MRLHLPIQDPCHEDWDAMSRTDGKRRFCDSCAKPVHDVSAMTEHEAWTVLSAESKPGGRGVCVRYVVDDLSGRIKYQVETVSALAPASFSGLLAAASVAVALLGTGCTGSEPTRVEADRCTYEVGPWSFTAERGEGTCPDVDAVESVEMGEMKPIDNGHVIDPPRPEHAVAGGLGEQPIMQGEVPQVEPQSVEMGKIAAPPSEHVKMGDVGPVDEPCDDVLAGQVGTTTTPTTPVAPTDRPRRL